MKTTRITLETEKILIIHRAEQVEGRCPLCCRQEGFILLDNAALTESAVALQINEWLETGKLHMCRERNGPTRICLASLLDCFELDANSGIRFAKEIL